MRCLIFIDGNNFYKSVKKTINDNSLSLLYFNYQKFAAYLCQGEIYAGIKYYIGAIVRTGDAKSEILYANQQRLIACLQKNGISVILGTIIRHPDGVFHEKGVDVRIAVEMIRLARLNVYDKAILISSDTDLVPAVEEVRNFGKEVLYVGFLQNRSFGLTKAADKHKILKKDDLLGFF